MIRLTEGKRNKPKERDYLKKKGKKKASPKPDKNAVSVTME